MHLSLRQRMLLPMVAVTALSLVVLGAIAYLNSRQTVNRLLASQTEEVCRSTVLSLEDWVQAHINDAETWSAQKVLQTATQDSYVGKAARKATSTEFVQLVQKRDYCEALHLASTNGIVVASSLADQIDLLNVSSRECFQAALNGKTTVSEALISKVSGNPIVIIAAPVKADDTVGGVLLNVVKLEAFTTKFIEPVRVLDTGYALVYDRGGRLLAHPDKTRIFQADNFKEDWGKTMLENPSGKVSCNFDGIPKVITFKACSKLPWGVAVAVPSSELLAPARRLGYLNMVFGGAFLGLSVVIILLVIRSITGRLDRIIRDVSESSGVVASNSDHISTASRSLAEGASEQAASLEETSASLEEMSSMTKRNAENAHKANDLAKQARTAADKGAADMNTMNAAMQAIKVSSDDIAKIIKTIDEIAFQTNILALNAAVEAARAGEAGMGFAVVADEVRNLAQRSAQAAKETAAKIEGAIGKTRQGVDISGKVAETLNEIVQKARQVDELVTEVANASREQTEGITQINAAVSQMDHVTQSNAASAEESASAAEELNSQAGALKQSVTELLQLVRGNAAAGTLAADQSSEAVKHLAAPPQTAVKTSGHSHTTPEVRLNGKSRSEIPLEQIEG